MHQFYHMYIAIVFIIKMDLSFYILSVDNQEIIFNPYCLVRILLENIKRRCDCTREGKCYYVLLI